MSKQLINKRKINSEWIPEKDFGFYWESDVKKFIEKIKSKMWDEEKEMSKEIKGHDWANGYSSACHDFRTCIIDELSGFANSESSEVKE